MTVGATPRGILLPLGLALAARLPVTAIGLVLLLRARELGLSYALGSVATGAFALGTAAGSPLLGRLADRHGQAPVLLLSGAGAAVLLSGTTQLPAEAPLALIALALLCGMTTPPVAACLRGVWSHTLAGRQRSRAFALESSLQELAFMFGPLLLVSVAAAAGAAAALVLAGLMLAGFSAVFALLPEVRATRHVGERAMGGSPLGDAAVRTLVGVAVALGAAFGATDVGILAFAAHHDAEHAAGLLYGAWGCASLPAGLLWSRRAAAGDRVWQLRVLLTLLALASGLLVTVTNAVLLAAGLALAGAAVAPTLAVVSDLTAHVAPAGMLTETYAWQTTGMTCGLALGSVGAGVVGSTLGMGAPFGLAALALAGGAAVLVRRGARLRHAIDEGGEFASRG